MSDTIEQFKRDIPQKLNAILKREIVGAKCGEFTIERTMSGILMSSAFAQEVNRAMLNRSELEHDLEKVQTELDEAIARLEAVSALPQTAAWPRETNEMDRLREVGWAAQSLLNADTYVSDVPRQEAVSRATERLQRALGTWHMHHNQASAVSLRQRRVVP